MDKIPLSYVAINKIPGLIHCWCSGPEAVHIHIHTDDIKRRCQFTSTSSWKIFDSSVISMVLLGGYCDSNDMYLELSRNIWLPTHITPSESMHCYEGWFAIDRGLFVEMSDIDIPTDARINH